MKILVTGGAGFIGSHIVDTYINLGHGVTIIDDFSTGSINNINPKAKFFKADICDKKIEEIFQGEKFDIINHHAAQINVRKSLDDPLFDANVNILGSLNLLNLSAKYRIKRFIFASSGGAIYGEPDAFPITEDFPFQPLSPYGVAKVATENYLQVFAELYHFHYVILRYSNVYGPRQISKSEAGVISIFANQILKSEKCFVNGNGNQIRDYIYVSDVVDVNVRALDCKSDFFNIGTGVQTSVNDLIEILSIITGREIAHEHRDPIPGEVFKNVLDASKARERLKWQPKVTLKEGIKKTLDYFAPDASTKEVSKS